MQHVSDQQYRRPWMGSLTRYADWVRAVFTGWRRLCVLMALLCGAAVVVANENSNDAFRNLGDFNGDGKDDVLLRHEDGRWFYYPMNGRRHITGERGLADLTRKLDWQVAGIGDFNEDGKDDVLLRHEDGRWFYYPMDGRRHITSQRGLADLTRKLDWQVAGIGDFNEDGKDDVLLRHEDGRWFYYPMDGRRHITSQRGLADLTRKLDWRVAGIGDFNGDGKDDVLLRHTDGRWFYYPMDGRRHITSQRGLADLTRKLDWQVAGIGDFNDDGKDDVLLRHEDGRWFYYPMDGRRHITSQRGLADLTRKLDWRVAGIGDFNEDGKDDVLLRHEDGRWFYYPMDGRRHITSQRGLADLTRNLGWSLAGTGSAGGDGGSGAESPDLVVQAPSASDNALTAGESFTLSATVRNRGAARSASTTLLYYRSSDSTISSGDSAQGTDPVGGLAASGTSAESIGLTAPSTAGTYYYGACVDAVSGESDTGNNCSSGVRVTVSRNGDGSGSDDHGDTTASATSLALGSSASGQIQTNTDFDYFRVQVSRSGTLTAYTTSSLDTIGSLFDSNDSVLALNDEDGSGDNFRIELNVRPGTYYILVISTDIGSYTLHTEFSEGGGGDDYNNTISGAAALTLGRSVAGQIESGSDIDVFRIQVDRQGTLTLYTTGSLDTFGALFNRSSERITYDDDDGRSLNFRIEHTVSAGTYYILVSSYGLGTGSYTLHTEFSGDSTGDNGEEEDDAPDLVVEVFGISNYDGDFLSNGDTFTLEITVYNQGSGRSDPTTLHYYLSSDSTINSSDMQVGTDSVPGLPASGSSLESVRLTAPSTGGEYYYGACVESVSGESNTRNNCRGTLVTIGTTLTVADEPDLVVESPSVSDSTLTAGQTFTFSATVHNRGDGRSDSTTLRYYRSQGPSISDIDRLVGRDSVSSLPESGRSSESVRLTAPSSAGTYYYGACVDDVSDESNTHNNCSSGVRVTVERSEPVLIFTISDGCNDGLNVAYKFLELGHDRNLTGRVIPGDGNVYVTTGRGDRHTHRLSCSDSRTRGYCYGAERFTSNTSRYWGIGLDGTSECPSGSTCCYGCPSSGEVSVGKNLTCN